ncbi:hypothetical protein SPC668_04736 [Salmonella enterica subsp. enterica serovar Paratyphi C]|nr:hypothetical protein SPC668_04736 [Salmonella enterica subsp. enterica serovar Paratyphi C]
MAFTGAIRSLNHCQTPRSLSPSPSKMGASGANISPTGAKALMMPSITPEKNALMGSQYLRISSAPATIAAPTATIGQVIAPSAVTMALPATVKTVPSTPAAAIMALTPMTTGHATRPMPPIMPIRASAPPAIMPIVSANSLLSLIQLSSFSTYRVAV